MEDNILNNFERLYDDINLKRQYNNILYSKSNIGEFIIDNKKHTITSNNLLKYLNSEERKIRKFAYETVIKFFSGKEDEAAFLVNLNYKIKNGISHEKGFKNYFEEVLAEQFIPIDCTSFFETSEDIKKLFQTTLDIRRKALGLEKISHFDMYYFGSGKSYISYEEAKNIIKEALKTFGEEYLGILDIVFEEEWIHHRSSSLKKFGGRSYSSINTHPYIIVNWNNDLDSLYVLIHEIGGAISQYLSQESGSILYYELSETKVEFMSVLNEFMLSKYLLKNRLKEIDRKEVYIRILEFLKDDFFVPYEQMNLLYYFSHKATESILTSQIIEEEYDRVVKEFRNFEHFEHMKLNKKNWIKAHDQLSIEYNLNYIFAFILAINFDVNIFNKVINLCKSGERLNDRMFFHAIFGENLNFVKLNKSSIKKIEELIINYTI